MKKERGIKKEIWAGSIRFIIAVSLLLAVCMSFRANAEASGQPITVRFVNAYGENAGIGNMSAYPGQSIKLPAAPAEKIASAAIYGSPAWKPVSGKTDTYLKSSASLTYEQAKKLCETYGSGRTLTLYSTRALNLTFYTYDGTKKFAQRYYYEGTTATLSSSPNKDNPAYKGWTTVKNGNAVTYNFSQKVQMKEDLDLYLVTYVRVRYYGRNGSKLYYTGYYKRGSSITIPSVPAFTNYQALGWSTNKSASSASYSAGSSVKASRDLNLYAIYRYKPYTVRFTDSTGKNTSEAYKKLYLKAGAGEVITLPKLPAVKNYLALGWSYTSHDTTARLKAGDKVRISGNRTFYAVYRKARTLTISFSDQDGSTSSVFTSLNKTVIEGTAITLPAVPDKAGYYAICWRLSVKGEVRQYNAGTKIRVYGNCRFYAYYGEGARVILHYNDGTTYKSFKGTYGSSYTLPSMQNSTEYSFMGWGSKKGIVVSEAAPCRSYWQEGTVVKMTGTKHFYAILTKRSNERKLSKNELEGAGSPDVSAFKRIIFVGDSRTEKMYYTLNAEGINYNKKNVSFVFKGGSEYTWLVDKGYPEVLKIIEKDGYSDKRPTAIVFNSGVNALDEYASFVCFYKKIEPTLRAKNCKLFILSVNPINKAMIDRIGFKKRSEAEINRFNAYLRNNLSGKYSFIDTHSWLMQTGFSTDRGNKGVDAGDDDGLHYTTATYKRIYWKSLQYLSDNS